MDCWIIYRREMFLMWKKIGNLGYILSTILFPLIYLFAFSWGFGANADIAGGYVPFLSKGMIAITVMLNSFQQTAISVSVGRFYFRSFQTLLVSPLGARAIVLGMIAAGMTRGVIAGTLIYTVAACAFSAPDLTFSGIIGATISAACFGAFGFTVGLWADNQEALSIVINFIITPMTFFCGSFFPVERLPSRLQSIVNCLPLSLSNKLLRSELLTTEAVIDIFLLFFTALLLFFISVKKLDAYSE